MVRAPGLRRPTPGAGTKVAVRSRVTKKSRTSAPRCAAAAAPVRGGTARAGRRRARRCRRGRPTGTAPGTGRGAARRRRCGRRPTARGAERGEEGPGEHRAVVDDVHVEDGGGVDAEQPVRVVEGARGQQGVRLVLGHGEDDGVGAERLAGDVDAPAAVTVGAHGADAGAGLGAYAAWRRGPHGRAGRAGRRAAPGPSRCRRRRGRRAGRS